MISTDRFQSCFSFVHFSPNLFPPKLDVTGEDPNAAPTGPGVRGEDEKGTQATVDDIIRAAIISEYAGSLRFLGHSLVGERAQETINKLREGAKELDPEFVPSEKTYWSNEKNVHGVENSSYPDLVGEYCMPLCTEDSLILPRGASRNATPMACPSSDRNVSFFLEEMERRGFDRSQGGQFQVGASSLDEHFQVMHDTLFSACLFRILGRTEPYEHFARRCGLSNCIPKPSQLNLFLRVLTEDHSVSRKRTRSGTFKVSGGRVTPWISAQHEGVIPKSLFRLDVLQDVLPRMNKELKLKLKVFYLEHQDKLDVASGKFIGENLFQEVAKIVEQLFDDNAADFKSKHRSWLPRSILLDLYEVFDEPFGPVSAADIEWGFGSSTCLGMMSLAGIIPGRKKEHFATALQMIVDRVNQLPDCILRLLKLTRNPQGDVVHLLTGVKFGYKHAEHYMCKFYAQVKFTWSNWRKVLQSHPSSPYCWPRRWRQHNQDARTEIYAELSHLMKGTIDALKEAVQDDIGEKWVKSFCTFLLEREESPRVSPTATQESKLREKQSAE